mgnify:CR=1 FL=1
MLTSSELLSLFKKANGNCSDYRAADLLGVSRQMVSKVKNQKNIFGEEIARRAAKVAGIDVEYAVACIHAEAHRNDGLFPLWMNICRKLEPHRKAA